MLFIHLCVYFQAEKEKKGPQFFGSSLDIPIPAHHHSTLCVWLPSGDELTSTATDQDAGISNTCRDDQGGVEFEAQKIIRKDNDEDIPCPLEKYHSPLLHFRSYR